MTTPREIISNALAVAKHDGRSNLSYYLIDRITAAGFRILGPDEVDPVTVERVEQFTKSEFQRDFESPIGWRDQFATAIRAIGRKA